MEFGALVQFILKGLGGAVIAQPAGLGFNYVLAAVLGIGQVATNKKILNALDEIKGVLEELDTEIEELDKELEQLAREIILNQDWETLNNEISQPVSMIETTFQTFAQLEANDQQTAQRLVTSTLDMNMGVPTALYTLNTAILDNPRGNPAQPMGLLTLWGMACASAATSAKGYKNTNVSFGSPLDTAYQNLESYFGYLIGVQVKGLTLLVNAYNAENEPNLAQAAISTFQSNLDAQVQIFFAAVENLVVQYCRTSSLLQLLVGANWQASPLHRAGAFYDSCTGNNIFYVWVIGGNGGSGSFNVGGYLVSDKNPVSDNRGNVITLKAQDGALLLPDAFADGSYNTFNLLSVSGSDNIRWSIFRFRWVNPQEGRYSLVNQDGTLLQTYEWTYIVDGKSKNALAANLLLAPTDPTSPYTRGIPTLTIGNKTAPATQALVLSAHTALKLTGGSSCARFKGVDNLNNNDFTLLAWILPSKGCNGTILSNKCAYGNSDRSQPPHPPGASGVIFSISSDGKLHLAVDNGVAYYSIDSAATKVFDGKWHLVAGVRKASKLYIYVDGEPVSTKTYNSGDPKSMNLSGCSDWTIGAKNGNSSYIDWTVFKPVQAYSGLLSNISVWNVALSQSRLKALTQSYLRAVESKMLRLWRFDVGKSTEFKSNTSATLLNGASTTIPRAAWYPPASTDKWALSLDGSGRGYVVVPTTSLSVGEVLTISAWVYLDPTCPGNMQVVASQGFSLGIGEGDAGSSNTYRTLRPQFTDNEGNNYTFQAGMIPLGQWTLLTVNWVDGLQALGYINGQLAGGISNGSLTDAGLKSGGAPIYFGIYSDQKSFPFKGLLGRIEISNESESKYVGCWPITEGTGTQVSDQSGNGSNGTIQGEGINWSALDSSDKTP